MFFFLSFPGKMSLMNTLRECFYEHETWTTIQKIIPAMLIYKANKMLNALFDSHCSHVV